MFSQTPGFFSTAAESCPVMGIVLVCKALAIAERRVSSVHPGPTPVGEAGSQTAHGQRSSARSTSTNNAGSSCPDAAEQFTASLWTMLAESVNLSPCLWPAQFPTQQVFGNTDLGTYPQLLRVGPWIPVLQRYCCCNYKVSVQC